jgi:hypothetical protein
MHMPRSRGTSAKLVATHSEGPAPESVVTEMDILPLSCVQETAADPDGNSDTPVRHCTKSLCGSSSLFPRLRSSPLIGEIRVGGGCGRGFRIARDDVASSKPTLKICQATPRGTEWSVRIFSPGRALSTHRAAHGASVLAHEDAPTTVVRICWRISSFALMSPSIMALACC